MEYLLLLELSNLLDSKTQALLIQETAIKKAIDEILKQSKKMAEEPTVSKPKKDTASQTKAKKSQLAA